MTHVSTPGLEAAAPTGVPSGGTRLAPRMQAATALASLLAPLNSTMVAVALPDVRHHYDVGVGSLTWLVSSYLIAVAISQPAGGRLGDHFGHLRVVMAGLLALLVFSLAAALAWSFAALVTFRALQGIGAALVLPNCSAFLRKRASPDQLGRVLGANGAAISAGAALGPALGGVLLLAGDWRWLFLANIPASLVAFWLIARLERDEGDPSRPLGIDGPSLLALGGAFTGMSLLGVAARTDSRVVLLLALVILPGSVVAYASLFRVRRHGVVDLRLFTRRNYVASAIGVALANLVMYSALVSMPVYLAGLRGANDAVVGAMLFTMSAAMMALAPVAGGFADRVGSRLPIIAGALVLVAAATGIALLVGHGPLILLAFPLTLVGVALGISQAAQQSAALQAWPTNKAGSAAGTFSMMRYVGSVTGVAIIAAVLGGHPDTASFRFLFIALAGFAVANVGAALSIGRGQTTSLTFGQAPPQHPTRAEN